MAFRRPRDSLVILGQGSLCLTQGTKGKGLYPEIVGRSHGARNQVSISHMQSIIPILSLQLLYQ